MWVLPTRSRVNNCKRFINAWIETDASTPVYVRIDNCDPHLEELKQLNWPEQFTVVIGPREGMKASLQEMFTKYPNEPWYGFLADDLLPQTKQWDIALVERAGNDSISYPNDLGKKGKRGLPTHPCVGGDLVRAIGWFGFPATHHFYLDTIWQYIGERLNNLYRLDSIIVEHLHYGRNKSELDIIYEQSRDRMKSDTYAYNDWISANGEDLVLQLDKFKKTYNILLACDTIYYNEWAVNCIKSIQHFAPWITLTVVVVNPDNITELSNVKYEYVTQEFNNLDPKRREDTMISYYQSLRFIKCAELFPNNELVMTMDCDTICTREFSKQDFENISKTIHVQTHQKDLNLWMCGVVTFGNDSVFRNRIRQALLEQQIDLCNIGRDTVILNMLSTEFNYNPLAIGTWMGFGKGDAIFLTLKGTQRTSPRFLEKYNNILENMGINK